MDEPWRYYANWIKAGRKEYLWFHLQEAPGVIKFMETYSRKVAARGYGVKSLTSRVLVSEDEQVPEMAGDDGFHGHMDVLNAAEMYT